jgi:hypothetical protein
MAYESTYSTNAQNQEIINRFFAQLGYTPQWGALESAAIYGQEVRRFMIPGFDTKELKGRLLKAWQNLPIEVC